MEKIIKLIRETLEELKWKYEYDEEEKIFITGMDIDKLGYCYIIIPVYRDEYVVYTIYEEKIRDQYLNLMAEYLHRVNYGMQNGNFEMDYDDGEVRYKVFTIAKEGNISEDTIRRNILTGVVMFRKYGDGMLKIMTGEKGEPKEWVEIAEKDIRGK